MVSKHDGSAKNKSNVHINPVGWYSITNEKTKCSQKHDQWLYIPYEPCQVRVLVNVAGQHFGRILPPHRGVLTCWAWFSRFICLATFPHMALSGIVRPAKEKYKKRRRKHKSQFLGEMLTWTPALLVKGFPQASHVNRELPTCGLWWRCNSFVNGRPLLVQPLRTCFCR